jgi:hypothetical protein
MHVEPVLPKSVGKIIKLENYELESLLKNIVHNYDYENVTEVINFAKGIFKPEGKTLESSANLWIETTIYRIIGKIIPNLEEVLDESVNVDCLADDAVKYDAVGVRGLQDGKETVAKFEKLPNYLRSGYVRLLIGIALYFFMRDHLGISIKPDEAGNIQVEVNDKCLFNKQMTDESPEYCSIVDIWGKEEN